MASLDEIFYKEFISMMNQLKAYSGHINLTDIALPPEAANKFFVETRDKVILANITDKYFSKLNGEEALLWGSSALKRRKYDYKGEFLKDKNGNFITEDVNCPRDCVAIISPISLGVPNSHKPDETFVYVDMVSKKDASGKLMHRFVYIVPKKYCYKLNQTALVLSWNKLKVFYSGVGLSLQNGHILFVYIVPYKPTAQQKAYRVLHCKTSEDYSEELGLLRDFWIKENIIFNPADCELMDSVKGRTNMAVESFDGSLDIYERFDSSRNLSHEETIEEVDFV